MRVTLVHNPTAGDKGHDADALTETIRAHGHSVAYASTKEDSWQRVLDEPTDLVVAAGGDGTVRKAFKEVAHRAIPVTLLPLGSANNVATELGFDADSAAPELVAGWPSSPRRRYDVGHVAAPWGEARFFETVGGGVFADLLRRADDEIGGGDKVEQGLDLLAELLAAGVPARWELELDGQRFSADVEALEVMNVGRTGPAVVLAPEADPGDGRLDVVLVGAAEAAALAAYVEERQLGGSPAPPALTVRRARRVRLLPPESCPLRVDDQQWPAEGEPGHDELTVSVGWTLDVLVPRRAS